MVFSLHVGRLPLTISRIVSCNRILCEAAFSLLFCTTLSYVRWAQYSYIHSTEKLELPEKYDKHVLPRLAVTKFTNH